MTFLRVAWVGVLLAGSVSAQTVYRCTGRDGKTVFQQDKCEARGLKGNELTLRAGNTVVAAPQTPSAEEAPSKQAAPPKEERPQAPPVTPRNPRAEACLNWYRPLLRDPAGAYYTEVKMEERSVTMRLHATNGYGGYVTKEAACDFEVSGKLDDGWTKIRAERLGW